MKRLIIPIIVLLMISSIYAETTKTCIDSDTLRIITNKTITIDGVAETIDIHEEKYCSGGCVNGECKPLKLNMTVEIYIFFCTFGVLMLLISFLKSDVIIFKWLTVMIFLMLGASSFNINRDFCEYTSSGWDCYIQQYSMINVAYLWYGLGTMMLIYAFYYSVVQPAKEIKDKGERLRV